MKIKRPDTAFGIQPGKQTKPVKRDDYRAWIKTLPCVCCRKYGVDASHVSYDMPQYAHFGRGKGAKADDTWILPQCRSCHSMLHDVGERTFWHDYQYYANPHVKCLVLWGIWNRYDDKLLATEVAEKLIMGRELG